MSDKKYSKYEAIIGSSRFIIEEDKAEVGWYLYIYENGICTKDYLQDSLALAKEFAKENFLVSKELWREI